MTILMLNDDQSKALAESSIPVLVVDARGRAVGRLTPVTAQVQATSLEEQVAEAKRRMTNDDGYRRKVSDILEDLRKIAPE
jgi:hypothetical protein